MIKFFRKIRQKLLSDNKFSKYLVYAIGEIVLVVIGILIALQINNWNEANKNREKEALLLTEMKSNLNEDRKDLEYNIHNNQLRIEYNEVIKTVIEEKIPYSDTLKPYFGNIFGNFQLSENTSTWENLKSVGLDLISNDSLRYSISNLYSNKYEYLENLEKGLDDRYQWEYFYPQILKHINIEEFWVSGVPRNYENWIQDEEFYEVIKLNLTWRYYMQNQYELNHRLVLSLEKQIDRHLKSLNK
ncbi:DUF6090 family protein [Balneola vulgaris]|uniref:DUF6090 family protein n=1 Tax=Balneola vulgaris TaxID=287535 RepID=UPI0003730CB4|nr:DUF6090 family protein [Balneola vulgaris]